MHVDFLLIFKMKMGNDMAIDIFVQKYYHTILKYCCLHIGDYGYAEDMVQETFKHFFRTFSQYHHYEKALNYLYAIAANVCKDYLRKGKVIKENEITSEQFPEQSDSMENIEHLDVRMDLKNALNGFQRN